MTTNPETVIRFGLISASIWPNRLQSESGEKIVRTVNLQRRYKTDDGTWKTKNSFTLSELPIAIEVLKRALDYVASKEIGHDD